MAAAHQLADAQVAALAERRRPRIADVRVVRPDDHLRRPALPPEVGADRVERVGHVTVPQTPGRQRAADVAREVLLGVHDHPRALRGRERRLARVGPGIGLLLSTHELPPLARTPRRQLGGRAAAPTPAVTSPRPVRQA
jgi:hypothetical protein